MQPLRGQGCRRDSNRTLRTPTHAQADGLSERARFLIVGVACEPDVPVNETASSSPRARSRPEASYSRGAPTPSMNMNGARSEEPTDTDLTCGKLPIKSIRCKWRARIIKQQTNRGRHAENSNAVEPWYHAEIAQIGSSLSTPTTATSSGIRTSLRRQAASSFWPLAS